MYSDLGGKLKLLRTKRGITQDDLAQFLDLSKGQVSNLENGKRNLSLRQLEKICEFFKVDMSYFFMVETSDSCLDLIEKARILFNSNELSSEEKEDLFTSIMRVYLDSKEK